MYVCVIENGRTVRPWKTGFCLRVRARALQKAFLEQREALGTLGQSFNGRSLSLKQYALLRVFPIRKLKLVPAKAALPRSRARV